MQRALAAAALIAAAVMGGGPVLAQQSGACANPNALGVTRVVEIDTTGGPGFGFEHYKAHDFLRQGEVVLTFDDGPWPTTKAILAALDQHCTKATFFVIGKNILAYPEILREVIAGGHTIGTHTWSHIGLYKMPVDKGKEEIEKAFSAVKKWGGGASSAPFFRYPELKETAETMAHLGQRGIGVFSTDIDSFDFKFRTPESLTKNVIAKLEKKGKGIVLMHDFQPGTSKGIGQLLDALKAKGYKIVHLKAKVPIKTLPEYDAALEAEVKKLPGGGGGGVANAPTSSVVRTISESQPTTAAAPAAPAAAAKAADQKKK